MIPPEAVALQNARHLPRSSQLKLGVRVFTHQAKVFSIAACGDSVLSGYPMTH